MKKISLIKQNIILFLDSNKNETNSKISNFLGKDEGNISRHLKELAKKGIISIRRVSDGRITRNYNNLTELGEVTVKELKEDKKLKQVVQSPLQVVNKLKILSSKEEYDLDNINLRERVVPPSLEVYTDKTKQQVGLTDEQIAFLWKLYRKICNYRIKGDYQEELEKILKGLQDNG